ncbi:MAG: permease-like cell division protein FtsX [Patescibacteria group bacterium]
MIFLTIYRALRFALQGFWRNIWLSVVTIIILVLTLLSVSMVGGINIIGREVVKSVESKVDVSVYFFPSVDEADVQNIQYRLETLGSVASVQYISKDDALEQFRTRHQDDEDIINSLDELKDNPLGATLVVKAKKVSDYPLILQVLDDPEYTELVQNRNFDDNERIVTRLSDISSRMQKGGLAVSAVFVIISILIIFNTIRITIYTHREEIGIMKLVGASNWFVRFPFLLESLLYGLIAVVITMLVLLPLVSFLSPYVQSLFEGYTFDLSTYFSENILIIFAAQIALATVLSVVSSAVAVGKYLRV